MDGADLAQHPLNNAMINRLCHMHHYHVSNAAFGIDVYGQIPKYFDRAFAKGNLWNVSVTRRTFYRSYDSYGRMAG
jgi:hypothetical protein